MDREKRGRDDAVAVRVCARALECSGGPFRLEEGVTGAARGIAVRHGEDARGEEIATVTLRTRRLLAAHLERAAHILDDRFLAEFPSAAETLLQEYRDCRRSQCAQLLAGACARQGWVHLLSAREVTPLDWREKVMRYCAEERRVRGYADETDLRRLPAQPLIDGPDAVVTELLSARIPCDHYRAILARAEAEGDVRLAAYEKMIAHHVFAEVALFDQWSEKPSAWREEHGTPSYRKGYPSYIVAEKDASCFGGTWLIAALLLRCGIAPRRILYCHANQLHDGQMGAHGLLLLLTSRKEIMQMDYGYGSIGRHLAPTAWDNHAFIGMLRLFGGECAEPPVSVTTPRELAEALHCPRSMVVSPLFFGIASEHYWHVGIEFFHEGKLPEAKKAMEYARAFCPKNPDVLYYLGLMASREGRNDEAREFFQGALAVFDDHLRAHYALGELAEHAGDCEEACRRYARVAETRDSVWGDDGFLAIARRKLAGFPVPEDPLTYQI